MQCYHCGREAEHKDAKCEYGQGLPHCVDCVTKCEDCNELYCTIDRPLKQNEDGDYMCEECRPELYERKIR